MPSDPPPTTPVARRTNHWLPHALGLLAVALLLLLLVALSLWQERTRQHQQAGATAQNLARLLEAQVADVLVRADVLLQATAVLARQPDGADMPGAADPGLQALAATLPGLQDLRLADAAGRWRWRLGPAVPGVPAALPAALPAELPAELPAHLPETEEYQRARAQTDAGLIVTGPRRHPPDGPWHLVLSRALRNADGRFAGLVSADLPLGRFDVPLAAIDLGEHGTASLHSESLALIYRPPGPGGSAAGVGSTAVPAALREAVALNPLAGEIETPDAADGSAHISAYRKVQHYPLLLVVGLPARDLLPGGTVVHSAILALALATLATAGLATWRLQRSSQRAQAAAQRLLAAIVGASSDAIVSDTLDGVLTHWNPGAERLFGYSAAQMLGQSVQRLVPPEHRDQLAQAVAQVARGERVAPFETERLASDGRRIAVLITVSPVTAADGRVIGSARIARDIRQQNAMQAELRQLALHDPLTQLPNRRLLLDRLGRAQQTSRRLGSHAALLVLALDGIRPPNARLGPPTGDEWLMQVAQRLAAAVRETDTLARLGDEGFVLVCDNLGADALLAGQRLAALEAKLGDALAQPMRPGGASAPCSLRIGRRLFIGTGDAPERLIADADADCAAAAPPQRPARPGGEPQDDVNADEDDY